MNGSLLSVLGKLTAFFENQLEFIKATVYVIKALKCKLLELSKLKKPGLLAIVNNNAYKIKYGVSVTLAYCYR